ncbi:MAG TPA: homoserine kinase [Solirubrobacteraceae bacterium]|nr:homoserine kinase [Solirubrobacteraceae bacterium]
MSLERRRLVRVPGSSANLGPGFDVLAAALNFHLDLEVLETGSFAVVSDLDIPTDRSNLVVRAFERLHSADAFEFRISSEIPLAGGAGASGAAVVAGLMAADHIFELDVDVLALAAELEGHPDNAAASLKGGFVVCDGRNAHRFDAPLGLEAIMVVPEHAVATTEARAALAESVPLTDAVFNVARASMLMLGLLSSDWDLIAAGLEDRLHQPRRAHLYPRSAQLLERAPALGALGATISGAGPSVLVWTQFEQTGMVIEMLEREVRGWARVSRVTFESQGAYVKGL